MKHSQFRLIKICFSLILLLLCQAIPAQGLIGTPHSLILVYNFPGNYFYIELQGKDKSTTEKDGVFIIDNKVVQVVAVSKNKFLDDTLQPISTKEFIKKYIKWESDYIVSSFAYEPKNQIEFITSGKGREVAFWTYDMPVLEPAAKPDSAIQSVTQKQMFVITRAKDYVVGIYSPLFENDQFENIKTYLVENIDGLVESANEIDMEELNRQVNK